jgi:epoxyqueuosine reductase
MLETSIKEWADRQGYKVAWGPISLIESIRADFDNLRKAGALDPEFALEALSWFRFPEGLPIENPRSVVILVVPRPSHSVSFELERGRLDTMLPPTYVDYRKTMAKIRDRVRTEVLEPDCQIELLPAPLKATAAKLNLILYGRNNISYVRGIGSYYELVGLLTDVELQPPCDHGSAGPAHLPECNSCDRCIRACPTQAINEDRFLINAERCLTRYNESKDPFPDSVPPSAHHCLIGCLVCQRVCPLNLGLHRVDPTGVAFNREETEAFLKWREDSDDPVWSAVCAKLKGLGLTENGAILSRNLHALLNRRAAKMS